MTAPADPRTNRQKQLAPVAAALLAGLLVLPASYAVLRAYDALFTREANPALVVWSARIAMFWRLSVGAYLAAMIAPLVHGAARANLALTLRALYALTFVVAALIAAQGILLP